MVTSADTEYAGTCWAQRYLHSEILSPLACAKLSRCQQVVFAPTTAGTTLWKVSAVAGQLRAAEVPESSHAPGHTQLDRLVAACRCRYLRLVSFEESGMPYPTAINLFDHLHRQGHQDRQSPPSSNHSPTGLHLGCSWPSCIQIMRRGSPVW